MLKTKFVIISKKELRYLGIEMSMNVKLGKNFNLKKFKLEIKSSSPKKPYYYLKIIKYILL